MRILGKLIALSVFGLIALVILLNTANLAVIGFPLTTGVTRRVPTPTPAANTAANASANVAGANLASTPTAGDSTFPKMFTLGKDSQSEQGEVTFNHGSHALDSHTADGKSVMGCVECHHTEQPKSVLKPPLMTSERDVILTFESWKTSTQKVNECRACHFQEGNVPDGKKMPTIPFERNGKTTTRAMTNQLAFHVNCNTCHDAAAALRPDLKLKPGFATSKECTKCHKAN